MTLEVLLSTYPELTPYLEDGSVVYFEACLTQMRQGDLQLLVEGLLGIPWARLHSDHVSLACTTWSWAYLSKKRYRTLEGAAIDYEAQVVEKLLALTLKAAKDLHKVNGKALITFESPKHGSFKSNAQIQAMLRVEGFWLVELDYWPTRRCMGLFMDQRTIGEEECNQRRARLCSYQASAMIPRRTWASVLATNVRWWYRVRIIMWWCFVNRAAVSSIRANGWLMQTGGRLCPWGYMLDL